MALLGSIDGLLFLLRWFHFFFGIIWIGHLYYFNYVQGAFFGEIDAATKSTAIQKLVPRALWWFRWGAFWTMTTGLLILAIRGHQAGMAYYQTSSGLTILVGGILGLVMGCNVWFVIWPNQQVVIKSATQAASGGQPLPNAAASASRALVASRTNTMFSIPMLFFMGAASHLPIQIGPESNLMAILGASLVIITALEINALKGKTGLMTTIKGVNVCGFSLTAVLYIIFEIFK